MDHRPISSFTGWDSGGCVRCQSCKKAVPHHVCLVTQIEQSKVLPLQNAKGGGNPVQHHLTWYLALEGRQEETWTSIPTHDHLVHTIPRIFTIIQTFRRLYSHLHQWMCIHRWRWLNSHQNMWIIVRIRGLVRTKWSWHINLALQASTTAYVLWVTQCTMYKAIVHVFVCPWAVM